VERKEKPCKGAGKAKGYGCGSPHKIRRYGLCPTCLYSWSKETEEGKAWFEKNLQFTKNRKAREEKRESARKKKEWKESNKTLSELEQEARREFQRWIRMVDANEPCISCPSTTSEIWDGGHFYKAEIYSGLIFHQHNVHKQCRKCNSFLGGNENNYRLGLIKRYGEEYVLKLDALKDAKRNYKYTREELREIKETYLRKIRELDANSKRDEF